MPRQMPRYGIFRSRATWQARIFPSQPRAPKPPGTSTPSTVSRSSAVSSYDMFSASTQRTPLVDALRELGPFAEVGLAAVEPELLADEPVEPFGLQHLWDEIDVGHAGARDDGARIDVGEERDLVADVA